MAALEVRHIDVLKTSCTSCGHWVQSGPRIKAFCWLAPSCKSPSWDVFRIALSPILLHGRTQSCERVNKSSKVTKCLSGSRYFHHSKNSQPVEIWELKRSKHRHHWITNNMNMMITFLRCENCIELCKFRNDWFEVLAGLTLLSSKLPRLRGDSEESAEQYWGLVWIRRKSPVALTIVKRWRRGRRPEFAAAEVAGAQVGGLEHLGRRHLVSGRPQVARLEQVAWLRAHLRGAKVQGGRGSWSQFCGCAGAEVLVVLETSLEERVRWVVVVV